MVIKLPTAADPDKNTDLAPFQERYCGPATRADLRMPLVKSIFTHPNEMLKNL